MEIVQAGIRRLTSQWSGRFRAAHFSAAHRRVIWQRVKSLRRVVGGWNGVELKSPSLVPLFLAGSPSRTRDWLRSLEDFLHQSGAVPVSERAKFCKSKRVLARAKCQFKAALDRWRSPREFSRPDG